MRLLIRMIVVLLMTFTSVIGSDQIPGNLPDGPIALVGGTIHTVSGSVIVNGALLIEGGKIVAVGDDIQIPEGARWVDTEGLHVYPGLIESYSQLGLVEVNTVRGSVDHSEVGSVNPNVRAEVAVNPDSERIPTTRANGILSALTVPTGGTIAGMSAVIQLDGWTYEEMTLQTQAGLHVKWPVMQLSHPNANTVKSRKTARERALKTIRETVEQARAYLVARQSGKVHEVDLRLDAMLPVLAKKIPVFVHADEFLQIEAAIDWGVAEGLRIVIVGGMDAWRSVEKLVKYDIPVIVRGTQRLPSRRWDPYDAPFTVPLKLHDAGVRFCISSDAVGPPEPERNLPYQASLAAAYGLPKDEALKSVTLSAAEILGVGDRIGSIDVGKDATLIVTTGDPLEIRTHVTQAYIQGREVDLSSRHTMLYEKYQEKYRQLGLLER
jgi:imidazolonepropionase-like amidohydrolase